MNFLGILATPLGFIVEWIYKLIPNYGWTLIIFTLITRILLFPLMVKQQKSMARMSAFQPMMAEIQKKWANDKQRQQEEMMKFQQDAGFSMTAGCLPMAINMLVMFGIIEVVYRPMQYVMRISTDMIQQAIELANSTLGMSMNVKNGMVQNELINVVKQNQGLFADIFGDKLTDITNFNFTFFGIDLSQTPSSAGWFSIAIIIPILSVVTMVLVQIVSMQSSGQQMQGSMKLMPWVMSIMFATFSFTVPVGFSLYYTASNVFSYIQTIITKKMYDPDKMKEQVQAEIQAKIDEKKKKKQVTVKDDKGAEVLKEVNQAELDRLRLARARALAEERYKDE